MSMNRDFEEIKSTVEKIFGVNDALARTRKREVVEARAALFYVVRECAEMTLMDIERESGFDHANVHHCLKKCENLMDIDTEYKEKVNKCLVCKI